MHRISSLAVDKRGATAIELIIKSNRSEEDATGVRLKSFLTRNPVTGLRAGQADGDRTKRSIKIMQRPLCSLSRAYHRPSAEPPEPGKLASSERRKRRRRRRRRKRRRRGRRKFHRLYPIRSFAPPENRRDKFAFPRCRVSVFTPATSLCPRVITFPRRLNSRQLLARSSLISLEIKDDEDEATTPAGETQYQREERDTNLTISRGTKTIPLDEVPGQRLL